MDYQNLYFRGFEAFDDRARSLFRLVCPFVMEGKPMHPSLEENGIDFSTTTATDMFEESEWFRNTFVDACLTVCSELYDGNPLFNHQANLESEDCMIEVFRHIERVCFGYCLGPPYGFVNWFLDMVDAIEDEFEVIFNSDDFEG